MKNRERVSDILIKFLEDKAIEKVFLLSGGMMMHLLDSVSKSNKINYYCFHHEQAAAMAAESYSRVSNKTGVCFATSGPGSTNTITGIVGAWLDSVPLIVITGQSRSSLTVKDSKIKNLRMLGNFEVDIENISKPITKYSAVVDKPEDILFHLEKAFFIANDGRPGPVLLDIPLDIQGAQVDIEKLHHYLPNKKIDYVDIEAFSKLIDKISISNRILIIGGHGIRVANQVQNFREMISEFCIPIVTTQLANDLIQYDNQNYIGKVGLRGDRAGNFAIQTADLIITIGTSLHVTTTGYEVDAFAPNAYKVVIDLDESILEKNKLISDIQIKCDIEQTINFLRCNVSCDNIKLDGNWVKHISEIKKTFTVINENHNFSKDFINTYSIVNTLGNLLKGDEVIITDAGSLYYIVGQTFRVKGNQRVIISGALGAMGYALPASIGACIASPSKSIICLTGDGSMQTNVQELQTLSKYNLNCKIIVINNKGYASIRNTQASFLDGHIAASSEDTGVTFPNWEQIASAYSLKYYKIVTEDLMAKTLSNILSEVGPSFCEIVISENVVMMPAVTSIKLPDGSFRSNTLNEMSPILNGVEILDISKYQ
jgi:acetolactate synthase-1/2/3 large subunit